MYVVLYIFRIKLLILNTIKSIYEVIYGLKIKVEIMTMTKYLYWTDNSVNKLLKQQLLLCLFFRSYFLKYFFKIKRLYVLVFNLSALF